MGVSQGSPTPRPRTATGLQPVRNQVAQQEVSGEQSKLHLPLPISLPPEPSPPPPTRGKIVSHETRPWCQKGWGPLVYLMPKFIKLYTLNMCSFLYLNNTSIKCFLKKLSILHFAHAEEFCLCCRIRRGRVTSSL